MCEFYSPGDLLASIFSPGESPQKLTLLTGPRGYGKTTWCRKLYQEALQRCIQTQGLLSIPVFTGNQKTSIDLFTLSTHQRHSLAIRSQNGDGQLLTPGWKFRAEALQWGNRILSQISNPQLLIIDELGPMEFYSQEGWQTAFSLVSRRDYHWAVVVIRPSLIHLALQRWPWGEVLSINGGVS